MVDMTFTRDFATENITQRIPEYAQAIEANGFEALFAGEVNDMDAVVPTTLAGMATSTIELSMLCPVYLRSPTVFAMTISTLARAFPGRVSLTLAPSSPLLVETWNGVPWTKHLSKTRDILRFLRTALNGERVKDDFATFSAQGFRLRHPPEVPPEINVAALGPRMLQFADAEADRVIIDWVAPDDVDRVDELPKDRKRITIFQLVCPADTEEEAYRQSRQLLADYLVAPAYASWMRRTGRGPQLEPLWEAWARGDREECLRQVPRELLHDMVVSGSPQACRERLKEYTRDGARVVAVPIIEPHQFAGTIRGLGTRDIGNVSWTDLFGGQ